MTIQEMRAAVARLAQPFAGSLFMASVSKSLDLRFTEGGQV